MGVVEQAVADRVGLVGISDSGVPALDGDLAGDECRGALGALLDHLDQVSSFGVAQRREQPVIDGQKVGLGELGQEPSIGSVAPGDREIVQEPEGADIDG